MDALRRVLRILRQGTHLLNILFVGRHAAPQRLHGQLPEAPLEHNAPIGLNHLPPLNVPNLNQAPQLRAALERMQANQINREAPRVVDEIRNDATNLRALLATDQRAPYQPGNPRQTNGFTFYQGAPNVQTSDPTNNINNDTNEEQLRT